MTHMGKEGGAEGDGREESEDTIAPLVLSLAEWFVIVEILSSRAIRGKRFPLFFYGMERVESGIDPTISNGALEII